MQDLLSWHGFVSAAAADTHPNLLPSRQVFWTFQYFNFPVILRFQVHESSAIYF
jgi:hypothetical protein